MGEQTIRTPDAALHLVTHGSGEPVTLFVHGLGATIDETRPLASGVVGTRAFVHLRGHGPSSAWGEPSDRWTYAAVTRDLLAAQQASGATRALGVSLGAAALMGLVAQQPTLLERCVFFLPAVVDVPRRDAAFDRLEVLADLVDARDVAGLETFLVDELPAEVRDTPGARAYLAGRARTLAGGPVGQLIRGLTPDVPIADPASLAAVTARCLVVAQEGDPLHTVAAAARLAGLLPDAQLHVFSKAGALWTDRKALRALLADFLNAP